jgi:hypothetical protein
LFARLLLDHRGTCGMFDASVSHVSVLNSRFVSGLVRLV